MEADTLSRNPVLEPDENTRTTKNCKSNIIERYPERLRKKLKNTNEKKQIDIKKQCLL